MNTTLKTETQGPKDHDSFDEDKCNVEGIVSFDDMPLSTPLLRGIYSYGFEKPSPIQQRAIVPMIGGGDIIAQAQSGTGKTGAFSIGLLQRMDMSRGCTQALVLCPTRELADQNQQVIAHIGDFCAEGNPAFCTLLVGGTRVADDIRKLRAGGVVVAVGTPGRVFDVLQKGALRPDTLKAVVLDEADEMLSQGFSEQVYGIFKYCPKDIQIALFSATMPEDVMQLTSQFMRDPTRILVKKDALTLEGIVH